MGVSGQHHAPAALYPRGKDPGTHCTGGWVSPRAGLDAGARRKILCPCRRSNSGHSVRSQTLYQLSYRGSPFVTNLYSTRTFTLTALCSGLLLTMFHIVVSGLVTVLWIAVYQLGEAVIRMCAVLSYCTVPLV
jgi:hypothetical protein